MVGVWHSLRSALQNTPSLRVSGRAPACRVSQEGERGFLQMQAVTLTRGLVTQPEGGDSLVRVAIRHRRGLALA